MNLVSPLERRGGTAWNKLAWNAVLLFLDHLSKTSRLAVVPVTEKSWSKRDRPVYLTFQQPLCKGIHGSRPVHTHHLLQGVAPARVRCPAGSRKRLLFGPKLPDMFVFFTWVFMLTRQLFLVLNQNQEETEAQTRDLFFWSVVKKRIKSNENGETLWLRCIGTTTVVCRLKSHPPHLKLSSLLHSHQQAVLPCKPRPALHHTCNTWREQYSKTGTVGECWSNCESPCLLLQKF